MSAAADKDLELLIKDVYRLSEVFGPVALRQLLLGYAETAVPDAQLSGRAAQHGGAGAVTLTAAEQAMCERARLDPASVLATKIAALADGTYPAAPE